MTGMTPLRNVLFVLLGVGGLLLKGSYTGPMREIVHSYAGNASASLAVYFLLLNVTRTYRRSRLSAALMALAAVSSFELTNGFGVMTNVYDPFDLLANGVGVVLAVVLDALTDRSRRGWIGGGSAVTEQAHPADVRER